MTLIQGYLELLENLTPTNKLDLISKLSLSVKSDLNKKRKPSISHLELGNLIKLLMK